jgi:hypothetical protein
LFIGARLSLPLESRNLGAGGMMQKILTAAGAVVLVLGLSGCPATSEIISLKNPTTGTIVTCGPYTKFGNINSATQAAQNELRYCVDDFQRQGYQRIAP